MSIVIIDKLSILNAFFKIYIFFYQINLMII